MKSLRSPVFNPLLLALVEQAHADAWTTDQGMDAGLWTLLRRAAADRDMPPHWGRWVKAWPEATRHSWQALSSSSPAWSVQPAPVEHEVRGEPGDAAWQEAVQAKEQGCRVWWAVPVTAHPGWAMGHAHKLGWSLRLQPDPSHPQQFTQQVLGWGTEVLRRPDWNQWVSPWTEWMGFNLREALGSKITGRREAGQTDAMRRVWARAQQDSGNHGAWEELVVALCLLERSRRLGAPCPIPKS